MKIYFLSIAVVATLLLVASCSSESGPLGGNEAATSTSVSAGSSSTVQIDEPRFASWQEFGAWQAPARLVIDGLEVGELATQHECFMGECGSPMEYSITDDFIVAQGDDLEIWSASEAELTVSWIHLGADLRWTYEQRAGSGEESAPITFDTPGLYHVDVRAEFEGADETARIRFRHFMWVQVVDPTTQCTDGVPGKTSTLTGVLDADGCPSSAARLDIDSLHPEFHCNPWPATVELSSRDFLRHSFGARTPEEVDVAPSDLLSVGAFIPLGELFESPADPDAIYIKRSDGVFERWNLDGEGLLCA